MKQFLSGGGHQKPVILVKLMGYVSRVFTSEWLTQTYDFLVNTITWVGYGMLF